MIAISFLKFATTHRIHLLTGIPKSQITSYKRSPETIPKETIKILRQAKYRYTYQKVRSAGATPQEAGKARHLPPESIKDYCRMRKRAFSHAEAKETLFITNRAQYLALREAGVMSDLAMKEKDSPISEIQRIIKKHLEIAKILSKGNGIKQEHILRGMRLSYRIGSDWDQYIEARKNQGWVPVRYDMQENSYVPIDKKSKRYLNWLDYKAGKRSYVPSPLKAMEKKKRAKRTRIQPHSIHQDTKTKKAKFRN